MLKSKQKSKQTNRTVIRKLTHNPDEWPLDMFCTICPDFDICGGISSEIGGYCYRHCCGGKDECQTVCRKNPSTFKSKVREIGGFAFEYIPSVEPVAHPVLNGTAPLISNGSGRHARVRSEIVAVKLRKVVNMKKGILKYSNREELADRLKIDTTSELVVTGIEQDKWVEPWWNIGRDRRRSLLNEFMKLGVALVTPPNFSLFCDQPRPDNFSAMKRIALVQYEFLVAGIPCALHPHIITEVDSKRWISFIATRPEIQTIAYEFTTGAGLTLVRQRHINHLINLAESTPWVLDLVVRGDERVIAELAPYYRNILYIDTNAFMKTIYRKKAIRAGNQKLDWQSVTTPNEISLDALLQHNVDEVSLGARQIFNHAA